MPKCDQNYSSEKSEKKPYFERPGGWHCKSRENDGALFGWTPIVSEREAKAGKRRQGHLISSHLLEENFIPG